jgi:hypothetical protein
MKPNPTIRRNGTGAQVGHFIRLNITKFIPEVVTEIGRLIDEVSSQIDEACAAVCVVDNSSIGSAKASLDASCFNK